MWNTHCQDIVFRVNVAKFSQNPALLAILLATGSKTLCVRLPLLPCALWTSLVGFTSVVWCAVP